MRHWMRTRLAACGLAALGLLASCASSPSATDPGATDATGAPAAASGAADTTSRLAALQPGEHPVGVSLLRWTDDGTLVVGYADGRFQRGAQAGDVEVLPVQAGAGPVVAVSPEARVAVVAAQPPVVVRSSDGGEVLRMTGVGELAVSDFFDDGSGLLAAEPSGKLHIWELSVAKLLDVPSNDLQAFVDRQTPSFSAEFTAPTTASTDWEDGKLLLGTGSGKVLGWSPETPSQVEAIVTLGSPITTLSRSATHVVALAADGAFGVVDLSKGSFLPWSIRPDEDAPVAAVAAHPQAPQTFAQIRANTLSLRALADGQTRWSVELPAGRQLCGLAMGPTTVAVCLDDAVALFDATSGEMTGGFWRGIEGLRWAGK